MAPYVFFLQAYEILGSDMLALCDFELQIMLSICLTYQSM